MKTLRPLLLALFISTAPAAIAAPQGPGAPLASTQELSGAARASALAKASQALNQIATLSGQFEQITSSGSIGAGQFYLSRPGRLRFEYYAPNPLLIVADGATVAIQDRGLKTVDRLPLRATPLYFVLKKDINLEKDAKITGVTRDGGAIAITARDRKGETDGQITLYLDAETMALRQWRVIDGQGQATTLTLQNTRAGARFDPKLFILQDAKDPTARKNQR